MPVLIISAPAHALLGVGDVVVCANCADAANQAIEIGKQALQYKLQFDQYTNQLTNTLQLPLSIWTQVQSDISQVRNLANAASILTGSSGSILTRLQSAQGYSAQATYLPQNIAAQFSMYQQALANSSNSLGRVLAVQQQQQLTYAGQQQMIAAQSQAAVGQMQAIQATNETLGLISTQMNEVQVTMTSAAQQQATRDNIAAERQGIADAYAAQFMSAPYASLTGYPTYK